MIRIIDRFYPNAANQDVLVAKNNLFLKQAALDSNKMLNKSNNHLSGKAIDTTLIEVPKKGSYFF